MPITRKPVVRLEPAIFTNPTHMSLWHRIRSLPSVHSACRNPTRKSLVTIEEHRLWWEATSKSQDRLLCFIMCNDLPVGILRFDRRRDWTEIWLAIKPEFRRQGIGTQALLLAESRNNARRWPSLGAVVNGHRNPASWRLFMRAGFLARKAGFIQLIQPRRHP